MQRLRPLLPEEAPQHLEAAQLEELLLGVGEVPQHGAQREESLERGERSVGPGAAARSREGCPLRTPGAPLPPRTASVPATHSPRAVTVSLSPRGPVASSWTAPKPSGPAALGTDAGYGLRWQDRTKR